METLDTTDIIVFGSLIFVLGAVLLYLLIARARAKTDGNDSHRMLKTDGDDRHRMLQRSMSIKLDRYTSFDIKDGVPVVDIGTLIKKNRDIDHSYRDLLIFITTVQYVRDGGVVLQFMNTDQAKWLLELPTGTVVEYSGGVLSLIDNADDAPDTMRFIIEFTLLCDFFGQHVPLEADKEADKEAD